ncbi:hypothetical protein, unknown function [Leishmania infantum JPCM5]|uniref:Uncharacterized protein n=3 Tax=Leishmania donovani species complex TaxID=38574 RepID=A4I2J4_LEIIN|nr:hypothetical protein, unknown function [Leishmania infantum JPCM5]XP_003861855.1 hypothetical protein, unknown function [Leishmania donovani]CAC9497995.1 hypothetical_protein_-_conserved [Leishmania infantum]AYU79875.1 hypothetical protein LdCL_260033100 [Leishmania donovani]TPP41294.1 hypothetical protein CGC21_32625 [Leishmania donovani]CAM68987.1 hypothetical protein, unknown function [Leishmania infantum JPCM5]CBZ35158.1 hypothetical protein, unknown function [Leishmania donovani]|eukprot:XP_001470605.1 hypothetical protein, unknown function [Leishmania infantum JPCM5]
MISQCFYLAALITTAMTITTSNVTFYQEGLSTRIDGTPTVVRNIAPDWIETAAMTVSSTTKELAVVLADPLRAHMTADVTIGDSATAVAADVNVSIYGAFNISKIPHDEDCNTQSFVMNSCHVYMRVSGTVDTVAQLPADEQNICDAVSQITHDLITPVAFIPYPPVVDGATDIAKSTYLMKYRLVNVLSENTGLPVEAHFVRKNVLRVAFGSFVRTSILFDSAYDYDVDVLNAMAVLSRWATKKLNISIDPENSTTTRIPFHGGAVTVPTLRSIVRQAIHEDALATLRTLVPRGASVSYDVVINDFQCKLFNTICSVPVSNGVQVINTRFRGMGDLGTILDNTASASMDALLTNITTVAFKLVGSTFGDRIYLPVF